MYNGPLHPMTLDLLDSPTSIISTLFDNSSCISGRLSWHKQIIIASEIDFNSLTASLSSLSCGVSILCWLALDLSSSSIIGFTLKLLLGNEFGQFFGLTATFSFFELAAIFGCEAICVSLGGRRWRWGGRGSACDDVELLECVYLGVSHCEMVHKRHILPSER